jgi:type I restriction enzyme M protein
MDAAEYKHVVLGLIFLKYISDAFEAKHDELVAQKAQGADPEDPDEYRASSIFWVPKEARWAHLKARAPQPEIGQIVDDAMAAIERDNPSLKGVLPKDYARPGLDKQRLGQLINRVSDIGLGSPPTAPRTFSDASKYFLSQFASAEGKKGGQFYTPSRVVRVLVEMLAPYKGTRLRSLLRLRRDVCVEREVHRSPQRQARRHFHRRPGVELHYLASGEDESRDTRHRRSNRARRHVSQRPAS